MCYVLSSKRRLYINRPSKGVCPQRWVHKYICPLPHHTPYFYHSWDAHEGILGRSFVGGLFALFGLCVSGESSGLEHVPFLQLLNMTRFSTECFICRKGPSIPLLYVRLTLSHCQDGPSCQDNAKPTTHSLFFSELNMSLMSSQGQRSSGISVPKKQTLNSHLK